MSLWESQNLLSKNLVLAVCLSAADSERGGSDHHLHCSLPEVEPVEAHLIVSVGEHKGDGRGSSGRPAGAWPHSGESLQLASVGDDHKIPRLAVAG